MPIEEDKRYEISIRNHRSAHAPQELHLNHEESYILLEGSHQKLRLSAYEAYILKMSEAQALLDLPTFLADPADMHFRTNVSGASRRGHLTCMQQFIQ